MKKISRMIITIIIYGSITAAIFFIIKEEANNTSVSFWGYMLVMTLPLIFGLQIATYITAIRRDLPEQKLKKRLAFLGLFYAIISFAFFLNYGYRVRSATTLMFPISLLITNIRTLYITYKKQGD